MPQDQADFKGEGDFSFEDAMSRLEAIIAEMEQGGLSLQQMIDKAAEAAKLSDFCQKQLDQLEGKVQILLKDSASGQTWGDFDTPQTPE